MKEKNKRNSRLLKRAKKCLYGNLFTYENNELIIPSKYTYKGVWNWDSMFIALSVARWDVELALKQIKFFTDRQCEDGMLIDAVLFNGKVYDTISKPPVIAWVLYNIYERYGNVFDLQYYYNVLVKSVSFWENSRFKGQLFGYDSLCHDEWRAAQCKNESGWDNSVRWDGGADNVWAIDLNCYMVIVYDVLAKFASKLKLSKDENLWKKKNGELTKKINALLWDESIGAYCDYNFKTGEFTKAISPASYLPLFIGIASPERAEKMKVLAESKSGFYPLFPTVSYDNSCYSSSDYWRGPTWLNVVYFALAGLKKYGYNDLCERFKENILSVCDKEKRGVFEYYDSKTGKGLGAKQFSWSASFIIELINL